MPPTEHDITEFVATLTTALERRLAHGQHDAFATFANRLDQLTDVPLTCSARAPWED